MESKPTTVKRKQQEPEDVSDPEVQSDDEVEHIDDQVEHSASEILTKEVALLIAKVHFVSLCGCKMRNLSLVRQPKDLPLM